MLSHFHTKNVIYLDNVSIIYALPYLSDRACENTALSEKLEHVSYSSICLGPISLVANV